MIDRDRGVFMDVLSATSQFVTLCFEREKKNIVASRSSYRRRSFDCHNDERDSFSGKQLRCIVLGPGICST